MKPLKIALCITELNIGGAEKNFVSLVRGLDRSVFDPEVFSLRPEAFHLENSYLPILKEEKIPIHFLDINGPFSLIRGIFRMKKLLKDHQIDILQSFMFHANFVGRLAGKMAGVPVIVSGIRVAEKSAHFHLLLDRWTASFVDRYICVSRSTAEFTATKGKIPSEKIRTITNGINCASPKSKDNQIASPSSELGSNNVLSQENTLKILFVGRLTRQKGLDWLLETAPRWLKEGRELFLVGEGEEHSALEKQAETLSCVERIHFFGWRADIQDLIAKADLFVLPSRWEGMPNVVMEAMLGKLPILCTKVEGADELLGELTELQCCEFGNSEEFVQKMEFLLDSSPAGRKRRQELGEKNHNRIRDHFSASEKIREYENNWLEIYHQKQGKEKS